MDPKKIDWQKFVAIGKQLVGKPYIYGTETDLKDPDPAHIKALDCSELVEWLFAQFGVVVPDGSYNQFNVTRPVTGTMAIGDLGFKAHPDNGQVHHVGVYIGENIVLEAKGKAWGVILTPLAKFMGSPEFTSWGRLKVFDLVA